MKTRLACSTGVGGVLTMRGACLSAELGLSAVGAVSIRGGVLRGLAADAGLATGGVLGRAGAEAACRPLIEAVGEEALELPLRSLRDRESKRFVWMTGDDADR